MNKPSQMTFAPSGFEAYRKPTRRERFLAEMDRVVPWGELVVLVRPAYAKATSGPGWPPIPLERMLRIYFLQHWFDLSDPAVEEALYDISSMRGFVGIDLGRQSAPDETTVCKFRHLLEEHGLGKRIFEAVGAHLQSRGMKVSSGTIVDATIIAAPSSTKNAEGKRDPEMHQTKKGNDWHFGMKAHVGVDKKTKLIHSVVATPANVADGNVVGELLHGKETHVWGDAAYSGQTERIRAKASMARDLGTLPRHRQERQPPVRHLCAGESVHRPTPLVQTPRGVVRPKLAKKPHMERNRASKSPASHSIGVREPAFASMIARVAVTSDVP